jgi:hypothetical protein
VGSNWTVPQGRVVVKCWQGSTLIATTYSQDGYYLLNDIPAGTGYKVTGEIWIDGTRYYDERVNITVESGLETRYVDLLLVPASAEPTDTPPSPTGTLTETPTQIEPTSTVTPTVPTATATITPTVPTEVPSNEIWLEAECGTVGSNFEVHADGSASNGGYVEVQNGYNSTGSAPQDVPANRVRLTFSLDEAGTYRVWGRVQAPSANDDSFWVRIDGSSTWYQWNNIEPGGNWHWDEVHDSEHGDTVVDFNLAAGSHTLDFAYREDGTRLDKVYITNTGDTPSGLGGTAPSCSVSVPTTIAWDDFEDRWWNWDGGSGWTGVWDHGGSSEIYNYGYNWRLQVRDDDGWAARTVNMSGVTGAHMQFIWRASSFESGEWAEVEIYDGSWHQVLAVYNGQDDGDWHNVDVDLSSYNMPGNFQVRVRAHMGNDQDYFYIDDLVITGSR